MADHHAITADYVRSILEYDPETGVFTWRHRPDLAAKWNTRYAGQTAGGLHKGYGSIAIHHRHYASHRLAWLYMTGKWPDEHIDHADANRINNRFSNLRAATRAQNMANSKAKNNTRSGFKGVCASRRKWVASIGVDGKKVHLGHFGSPEEAHKAYCQAAERYYGTFARFK